MSDQILERFLDDVKNHTLTINLDQGIYRDLTISIPVCSDYHYNITTRPGYLMITGDMGSFTFYRSTDMFNFFRNKDDYRIKAQYWSEKLEAVCKRGGATSFDFDSVKSQLQDRLECFLEYTDDDDSIEAAKEAVDYFCNYVEKYEWEYINYINNWDSTEAGGLSLEDFWECKPEKFTHHYIWACYAIIHAIKLYDLEKAN